jgi:hypothetical protein
MTLTAAMNRLIPPVDDLPGAGAMLGEALAMAERHDRFRATPAAFAAALPADFAGLGGTRQDAALRALERTDPRLFHEMLELVSLAYYADARVQARIGWRPGPLQPRGFPLPPFDEQVLATARQRAPFWRLA